MISDFERGLLFGWTCQADMPAEIRNIIKKIARPEEQFDSVFEGDDLDVFMAKAKLTARTISIIKRDGYLTLDDLLKRTDGELLKSPSFGRGSLNELLYSFKRFGLVGRRAEFLNKNAG